MTNDASLAAQLAALDAAKLGTSTWATADSTTNYVRRTGDILTGPLTVQSNLLLSGNLVLAGSAVTNALFFGDGSGLTNIPAAAVAEADPHWAAASNGLQAQLDAKTPWSVYQAGTATLWAAVAQRATQADLASATGTLNAALATETGAREAGDSALSNAVATLATTKADASVYTSATGQLWSALATETTGRLTNDAVLATQLLALDAAKLDAAIYAAGTGLLWAAWLDERTSRLAGDAQLSNGIAATEATLALETAVRSNADVLVAAQVAELSTAKVDQVRFDAATNELATASHAESTLRVAADASLSNSLAALDASKLGTDTWAAADATTNYVHRTGDVVSGSLTVMSNLVLSGSLTLSGGIISNASYVGDGAGLSNIPARAIAEADPLWTAASNALLAQLNAQTPLVLYQNGTSALWSVVSALATAKVDAALFASATGGLTAAINDEVAARSGADASTSNLFATLAASSSNEAAARTGADAALSNAVAGLAGGKLDRSVFDAGTNALWAALGNETSARLATDTTLSNRVTAVETGKLATATWNVAPSTTNYVRRTGDTLSGSLSVQGGLSVTGTVSVAGTQLVVLANGNVGIGIANPTNRLAVNGTIAAREVVVTLTGWPDYVFRKGYPLMPLPQVEEYLRAHGHLPGVPDETEVATAGVGLGQNQAALLRKIEELTLHMIELDKDNARLRERVERLEHGGNAPGPHTP